MFGRRAIKGSCGGASSGSCVCVEKCDKSKAKDAEIEIKNIGIPVVKE
jgi:hypothetical protein